MEEIKASDISLGRLVESDDKFVAFNDDIRIGNGFEWGGDVFLISKNGKAMSLNGNAFIDISSIDEEITIIPRGEALAIALSKEVKSNLCELKFSSYHGILGQLHDVY